MSGFDWTRVQGERCPECGCDPSRIPEHELADAIRRAGAGWRAWLVARSHRPEVEVLRRRPGPDVWSPLEYACHVRDVLVVFTDRVETTVVDDRPDFGWWDHEAAAVDECYNEQDPDTVAGVLVENAGRFASTLDGLSGQSWARAATRRGTEEFTVAGMARFALHECRHHLWDAQRSSTLSTA